MHACLITTNIDDDLKEKSEFVYLNMPDPSSKCKQTPDLPDNVVGPSAKIAIRKSGVHGYGIFARELIKADELIEECKLLKLGWRSKYNHDPILKDYSWANQSCDCDECKQHGFVKYMALGFGSLYNHADDPNTNQKLDFTREVMRIWSKEDIQPNEEIFVSYGNKYWIVRDFWAQVNKNKQLEQFHKEQIKPKLDSK